MDLLYGHLGLLGLVAPFAVKEELQSLPRSSRTSWRRAAASSWNAFEESEGQPSSSASVHNCIETHALKWENPIEALDPAIKHEDASGESAHSLVLRATGSERPSQEVHFQHVGDFIAPHEIQAFITKRKHIARKRVVVLIGGVPALDSDLIFLARQVEIIDRLWW
eukprot:4334626-Amphidinium_carterae.1